jgi:hypothetical protein
MKQPSLKAELLKAMQQVMEINQDAQEAIIGKKVRITSNYNGQPYGRSRPSLRGKIFTVSGVEIGARCTFLWLKDQRLSIDLDDVEFVE